MSFKRSFDGEDDGGFKRRPFAPSGPQIRILMPRLVSFGSVLLMGRFFRYWTGLDNDIWPIMAYFGLCKQTKDEKLLKY